MLRIHIVNDKTGTDTSANYIYEVFVNHQKIASGKIAGHNRSDGWQTLVRHLTSSSSRAADSCACKNGGWFDFKGVCINCGGAKPPPA